MNQKRKYIRESLVRLNKSMYRAEKESGIGRAVLTGYMSSESKESVSDKAIVYISRKDLENEYSRVTKICHSVRFTSNS